MTWITGSGRALACRVDQPEGEVVGAVVIAGSFDREAIVSFRLTRALAARAAAAGFVAYNFHWSGDADSGPRPGDPDEAWAGDLAAVVAHARAVVGDEPPVHIIGYRLGAAVAALLGDTGPGRRVYWEPVSGRAFLRAHRAIRAVAATQVAPLPAGIELDGAHLSDTEAAALRRLKAPTAASCGPGESVRMDRDRARARSTALGAPYFAHVPLAELDEIVAGLPRGPASAPASWSPQLTVTMSVGGHEVVETMCEVGPRALPAIITSAREASPRVGLLMTAMGSELKSGPAGLWPALAREFAPLGVRSLRVDRSHLADDADTDLAQEPPPYVDSAVEDMVGAHACLSAQVQRVVGIGVCAGAWAMLRAVARSGLREVVAVNPVHWNPDESVYTDDFYSRYHHAEPEGGRLLGGLHEPTRRLVARFPRLRVMLRADLRRDKVAMMLDTLGPGTVVTLLFGSEEGAQFHGQRGRAAARRAARAGACVRYETVGEIDHNLFAARARQRVTGELRRVLGLA